MRHISEFDSQKAAFATAYLSLDFPPTASDIHMKLQPGVFTISKLELQMEIAKGNLYARRFLALRKDANYLLVTILWGNVAVNVLLALLSGSVLTGFAAFLFSTVIITIFSEIFPSRHGGFAWIESRSTNFSRFL